MPRRKLARRFEPRSGVSDSMLDVEVTYVQREVEDYRIYSHRELAERLQKRLTDLTVLEAELEFSVKNLSDRDRLVIRNLLARDCWYLGKLYERLLSKGGLERIEPNTGSDPVIEKLNEQMVETGKTVKILPFQETLFG